MIVILFQFKRIFTFSSSGSSEVSCLASMPGKNIFSRCHNINDIYSILVAMVWFILFCIIIIHCYKPLVKTC